MVKNVLYDHVHENANNHIVIDDAQTFWFYATSKVKKNDNYYRTM